MRFCSSNGQSNKAFKYKLWYWFLPRKIKSTQSFVLWRNNVTEHCSLTLWRYVGQGIVICPFGLKGTSSVSRNLQLVLSRTSRPSIYMQTRLLSGNGTQLSCQRNMCLVLCQGKMCKFSVSKGLFISKLNDLVLWINGRVISVIVCYISTFNGY